MPRDYELNRQMSDPVDSNPIELPLGRDRPQSMKDEIMEAVKAMIQNEREEDLESVEEFWDLDIDEDKDPLESAYELDDMIPEFIDYEEAAPPPERLEEASSPAESKEGDNQDAPESPGEAA